MWGSMELFSLLQAVEREWWQNWGMFYYTLTTTSTSHKLEVQLGATLIVQAHSFVSANKEGSAAVSLML